LRGLGLSLKMIAEWLFAFLALWLLLPLLLFIALVIKLTSRGPVLYVAERLGRAGKPFRMLKFRSMHVDSPEVITADRRVIVADDDPRLTSVGKLLRSGLDELPQLLNVLKGEMALVGPRPDTTWMLPEYTEDIRPRLEMRPGITGLAQVLRGRDLSPEENYRLDMHYVRHWSPWMDVRIALYTVPYMLGAKSIGRAWLEQLLPNA
jgi:undecaprenyl phosphate N,N'-diacetylbacillosamine 1-phosphate transferase